MNSAKDNRYCIYSKREFIFEYNIYHEELQLIQRKGFFPSNNKYKSQYHYLILSFFERFFNKLCLCSLIFDPNYAKLNTMGRSALLNIHYKHTGRMQTQDFNIFKFLI